MLIKCLPKNKRDNIKNVNGKKKSFCYFAFVHFFFISKWIISLFTPSFETRKLSSVKVINGIALSKDKDIFLQRNCAFLINIC